jgi:spore coat protein H
MEILTVHWDGYGMNRNNYRVFHDLDSNKMVFLPHGLDQMFGQWRSRPESPITPMMKGVVARAVISEPVPAEALSRTHGPDADQRV